MTVAAVARAPRSGHGDRAERKAVDARQAGEFDASLRRRKRRRRDEDEAGAGAPANVEAAMRSQAMWQGLAVRGAMTPGMHRGAMATGSADGGRGAEAVPDARGEAPLALAGNVQGRREGEAMHLRFTQGPWAGTELQAALHAGQVVVTLRAASARQQRALQQVRDALAEEVARETGQAIRLEIVNAAR